MTATILIAESVETREITLQCDSGLIVRFNPATRVIYLGGASAFQTYYAGVFWGPGRGPAPYAGRALSPSSITEHRAHAFVVEWPAALVDVAGLRQLRADPPIAQTLSVQLSGERDGLRTLLGV